MHVANCINMKQLLFLLWVILTSASSCLGNIYFNKFLSGHRLDSSAIYKNETNARVCECVASCGSSSTCTAVSIKRRTNDYECSFSSNIELVGDDVVEETSSNIRSKVMICPKPFVLLVDIGCVFFAEDKVAANDIQCPLNSKLFDGSDLARYNKMVKYLNANYETTTHYQFVVALTKVDGVWKWSSGVEVDSGVWAPIEPTNDGPCAGILFLETGVIGLNDSNCNSAYHYICEF